MGIFVNVSIVVFIFLSVLLAVGIICAIAHMLPMVLEEIRESKKRIDSFHDTYFTDILEEFRNNPASLCTTNQFGKVLNVR